MLYSFQLLFTVYNIRQLLKLSLLLGFFSCIFLFVGFTELFSLQYKIFIKNCTFVSVLSISTSILASLILVACDINSVSY